ASWLFILSLHDALPSWRFAAAPDLLPTARAEESRARPGTTGWHREEAEAPPRRTHPSGGSDLPDANLEVLDDGVREELTAHLPRSDVHTSELQSREQSV